MPITQDGKPNRFELDTTEIKLKLDTLVNEIITRAEDVGLEQCAKEYSAKAYEDLERLSAELRVRRESREWIRFCRIADRIRKRTKNPDTLTDYLLGIRRVQ
ncbi:MAG: hypothetical protein JWL88_118 [Parcubacteria group bacterium]|nr:hypothetical protein [Parcubacteria group bacterium]